MESVSGSCSWAYELLWMYVCGYMKSASVVVKHMYLHIKKWSWQREIHGQSNAFITQRSYLVKILKLGEF
jgi:hypothetical protein